MIRPLSLFLLLSASAIVLGQPLYKWVEPDGSITFSVKPPPAGVTFEQVDADKATAPIPATSATVETRTNLSATSKPSMGKALPQSIQSEVTTQRVAPPVNGSASARIGIFRTTSDNPDSGIVPTENLDKSVVGAAANGSVNRTPGNLGKRTALEAKSRKQRQCEDLQKRVVSLERRLRSRLTPDDMDNTVVHMARYQRSFDQHCVQ